MLGKDLWKVGLSKEAIDLVCFPLPPSMVVVKEHVVNQLVLIKDQLNEISKGAFTPPEHIMRISFPFILSASTADEMMERVSLFKFDEINKLVEVVLMHHPKYGPLKGLLLKKGDRLIIAYQFSNGRLNTVAELDTEIELDERYILVSLKFSKYFKSLFDKCDKEAIKEFCRACAVYVSQQ